MYKYWSPEEFVKAVKQSKTITEVLSYFGLPRNQGYYNRIFHKTVIDLNVDISHLVENFNQKNFRKKTPTNELLISGKFRNTKNLKIRLLKEGLLQNKCYECSMNPEWNGKKLSLHLDHINGNNTDNRLENLRLLCPNCHSQTETYCGAKAKKEQHAYKYVCKTCGGPKKYSKSKECKGCQNKNPKVHKPKIKWPAPALVLEMVKDTNFLAVGKKLGVSDNAVRKFLKRNGIDLIQDVYH